ncbi:MAG: Dephospho-CoA kinase [Alphaproteobacteria bacterium MarineAlpha3_Bin5]|nr:dephospho-CoA kinase [Magnetovibrio sp.]PPR78775.1 MAG: Dephospho-CoA kinase [Alphaproteobacteria bacterium MarineAlpha3_Bin5]
MITLGLTGSIAMGKSTAATHFRRQGVRVYDADATIHKMLNRGGCAVSTVNQAFPGVALDGIIDRKALGDLVFSDKKALTTLESILHPLVKAKEIKFLKKANRDHQNLVVLEIPLLFETERQSEYDFVACVSSPPFIQYCRAMRRANMTLEKFKFICKNQLPNSEKCQRSDFIIHSGLSKSFSLKIVQQIIAKIRKKGIIKNA